ncbi:MAG: YlbF family regulator [Aristaeellaceae bacterium]
MQNVMNKAQELAQAILESDIYQRVHAAESQVTTDPGASEAIAAYMEKRQAVEALLGQEDVDRDALAEAGRAMQEAEQNLNEQPLVKEMQAARADFNQMMENINQILRLIITGETEAGGCSGSCESCGGCGSCGGCQ